MINIANLSREVETGEISLFCDEEDIEKAFAAIVTSLVNNNIGIRTAIYDYGRIQIYTVHDSDDWVIHACPRLYADDDGRYIGYTTLLNQ